MSKTTLTLLLSELALVRVICRHQDKQKECGAVVEVPIAQLKKLDKCPVCRESFRRDGEKLDRFTDYADAVERLLEEAARFEVEFVTPAKGE